MVARSCVGLEQYYGPCTIGPVTSDINRNWRVCISGPGSRWLSPILLDSSDEVLIDPNVNNIDPSGRQAEYLLNCQNNAQKNIILYKTQNLSAIGSIKFDPSSDPCTQAISAPSLTDATAVTITLSLPDPANDRVRIVDFRDVVFTNTTLGTIQLGAAPPILKLDNDGDGSSEESLAPDTDAVNDVDFSPPAPIIDVTIDDINFPSMLVWIAPGNDGNEGTATNYDIRYSLSPITENNWDIATPYLSGLKPSEAGTIERLILHKLPFGKLYFGIMSYDQDYNYSDLSNIVHGSVLDGLVTPHFM